MPLANGEVFAGYRILRLLGAGGMGEVYLAQHPRLPRRDALKILPVELSANREFRDRFNREADLVATLYHPHIIGVHDRGETDGRLWLSMDFIDGPDAGRLMRERFPGGLPRALVVEIAAAVSDALDYAHRQGLLHRDIKPANILLTGEHAGTRRVLLADFGIARNVNETSGLTATNTVLGTVSYAAPEQLTGQPLDGRADQYALAATAYELLSGTTLFADPNPAVVIGRHLNSPPLPLGGRRPDLADLDPVLARALAKNPADRFRSCAEFARALANPAVGQPFPTSGGQGPACRPPLDHTAQLPVDAPRPDSGYLPAPAAVPGAATTSKRWLISAAVLAALLFLIAFVVYQRPWESDDSAGPATTATTTAATATTSPTTSSITSATTTPSAPVGFDAMRDLVLSVYGALPGDPMSAWAEFDPNYQNRAGLNDFVGFWSTAQSVTVLSVTPRDAHSVTVRLRYVMKDGRVETEDRWLSVVSANGRLLVYDSERIGPA